MRDKHSPRPTQPWHTLTLTLLLVLVPMSCMADEPEVERPEFIVHTATGEDRRGVLRELAKDWNVRLGAKDGPRVPGASIVTIRRAEGPLPGFPEGRQIVLVNGDRIPVKSVRLDGEQLLIRHPAFGKDQEARVPLAIVALLWLDSPINADEPEAFRRRLATGARRRDRVLLRNGDALDGVLTALDDGRVTIDAKGKPVSAELGQVAALVLSREQTTNRPGGVHARVVLRGDKAMHGTRLTVRSAVTKNGTTLEGETLFGARLAVPLDRVAGLDLYHGRAVYLSDLKPLRYEHRPFFGAAWPVGIDSSVAGRSLRVGGSTYDKGLGLHSFSRLTYALPDDARRFEATVGLDEATGCGGSVRVRVLADGKPLDIGTPRELTGQSPPLSIGVVLPKAKELTLEVDFGARGDVQDHVNWADARLIR